MLCFVSRADWTHTIKTQLVWLVTVASGSSGSVLHVYHHPMMSWQIATIFTILVNPQNRAAVAQEHCLIFFPASRFPSPTLRPVFLVSAGIGRTGVLITMETAICLMECSQPVYPLDIVRTMRDQRAMMIQTPVSPLLHIHS